MLLHRVDGQEELLGDLFVRGRAGERAPLVRTAERRQHAALRGRKVHRARGVARYRRPGLLVDRGGAEGHRGGAEAEGVAIVQATAAAQALAVDERPVAREAIV